LTTPENSATTAVCTKSTNSLATRHTEKRGYFFIRLKSKEKISAILARKKSKNLEELVDLIQ
jgi:hypothetical protein